MNQRWVKSGLILLLFALASCEKKEEPNKIIDGLPFDNTVVILPAQATKEMHILKSDGAGFAVEIINRVGILNTVFPELTGPDGQLRYTFSIANTIYGSASFTMQFLDTLSSPIDPIATNVSTATLASVTLTGSGASDLFSYTETLTITLQTAGITSSDKFLTGTVVFTGTSDTITFTFAAPGAKINFEGMAGGSVSASGTGPGGAPISIQLAFRSDHDANGSITWEGQTGGIHIDQAGGGFVLTNNAKIPLQ